MIGEDRIRVLAIPGIENRSVQLLDRLAVRVRHFVRRTSEISIWNWPGSSLAWGSLVIQMRKDLADLPGSRIVSVAPPSVRVATGWPQSESELGGEPADS